MTSNARYNEKFSLLCVFLLPLRFDLAGHLVKSGTVPPKMGRLAGMMMISAERKNS